MNDLEDTVAFYKDVMGLEEQDRESGKVSLSCGYNESRDLVLEEGGTGIDLTAISATREEIDQISSNLQEADVEITQRSGEHPNENSGIQFETPTGQTIRCVIPDDNNYVKPGYGAKLIDGHTPYGLDHVTLASPDVKTDAEFLRDVLGFSISDIAGDVEEHWLGAWTRLSPHHHEIAFIENPPQNTLHHIAWDYASIEHMKIGIDRLARAGYELEVGIGRHAVGNNIFAYFIGAGGNRQEFTTGIPDVNEGHEPGVWEDVPEALSAWGAWRENMPESFMEGS